MARIRSPNYPAVGLAEAIDRVRRVHEAEHQVSAPREVIAQHLGYGGLNGGSLKMISALLKYGLLEDTDDRHIRVSDRAIQILYPETPADRARAIREAAYAPALWAEIHERWGDTVPSEQNLQAYLIRRQFAQSAIPGVIEAYRDTMDLVTRETAAYPANAGTAAGAARQEKPDMQAAPRQQAPSGGAKLPYETTFVPPSGDPFRVSFTGKGIEVSGLLNTPERADELVSAINALKVLLRPINNAPRPPNALEPSETIPATGNYWLHHPNGHSDRQRVILSAGERFKACPICGNAAYYTPAQIGDDLPPVTEA